MSIPLSGGPAGAPVSNAFVTLDPPDIGFPMTADDVQRLMDYLRQLSRGTQQNTTATITTTGVPTDGDVVLFDGISGLKIKDSGFKGTVVARGPGSSVAGHLATFANTDGVTLQDGGAPSTSSFLWVKVTLTDAQIKTAHSVPIQLVGAPGSGFSVVPALWYMREDSSAGAYSANPTFNVQYSGIATALLTGITPNLNSGDKRWSTGGLSGWGPITTTPENTAVVVQSTADVTGGNSANSILIMLGYLITK